MKAALGDGTVALLLKELEASLLSTSFTKRLSDHSLTRPFDVLVEESETTGQSSGTPSPDAYLALNFIYVSLLTMVNQLETGELVGTRFVISVCVFFAWLVILRFPGLLRWFKWEFMREKKQILQVSCNFPPTKWEITLPQPKQIQGQPNFL